MAEDFLRRWSRLKHEHAAEKPAEKPVAEKQEADPPKPLPPVEKLTPESDFSPFMQPKVEDAVRRAALKKMFRDPHFKNPDPLEAYSGDWTVGEPIPPEMLATLNQAKTLLFDKKEEEIAKEKPEEKVADQVEERKADEPRRQDA
jgi:hypothetical protein